MDLSLSYSDIPDPRYDDIKFLSGLDLVTQPKDTLPGSCKEAQNWEININGGYTTIEGYERFDGQAKPSDATYARLDYTLTGSIVVADTVTGADSSATGVVIAVAADGAQAYLVITKVTGTFNASEDLKVSAVVEGNTDATQVVGSAPTIKLNAQYRNLAADEYRNDIAKIPGSGKVLGIIMLNDVKYGIRNNSNGSNAVMYKSTSSGWSIVALGEEMSFTSGGVTEIVEGDLLEGVTSNATATITRVVLESGTWAAGTAAGRFIFASHTGTFQSEAGEVSASGDIVTITAASSNITMLPDGRFELILHNFGGQLGTKRIYGADGINRAFEFDGTVFAPIDTGITADTPLHIIGFENHLFLSFAGSAQHSGIGFPYVYTAIFGADELAVGDDITAFIEQPGSVGNSTLAIFSQNRINMLYGTSSNDWELVDYRKEVGAYAYSVQEFGMTFMLDDRGVSNLITVQAYGNFKHNTLSRLIQPYLNSRRTNLVASSIARDKSQFRLFFSDKTALYCTTENRDIHGFMPIVMLHDVTCIFSLESSTGKEEILFGSSDGFVYQMEKGTSFDGSDNETRLHLHPNYSGTYQVEKGYHGARFEVSGSGYSEFKFNYELGYNDPDIPQPALTTIIAEFDSVFWDTFTWDNFTWDGVVLSPSHADLEGDAENIALIFTSSSDYFSPITLSGTQLRLTDQKNLTV